MNILVISERWWPDGTGGVLASYLIAKLLQDAGFKLTVFHGTREPVKLSGGSLRLYEPFECEG